jgi:hypothetical protein
MAVSQPPFSEKLQSWNTQAAGSYHRDYIDHLQRGVLRFQVLDVLVLTGRSGQ